MTDQRDPDGTPAPSSEPPAEPEADEPAADEPAADEPTMADAQPVADEAPVDLAAATPPLADEPVVADDPAAAYEPPAAAAAPAAFVPPPIAPPVAWEAPPAVPAAGRRTVFAAVAGAILLVLGVLGLLIGVLFFAGTAFFSQLVGDVGMGQIPGLPPGTDTADIVAGAFAFIGVILIAFSLLYVIAGFGVLQGRGWGRGIGVTIGVLSGLFWLAGLVGGGDRSGLAFAAILLGLHLYVLLVLVFRWRSRAT